MAIRVLIVDDDQSVTRTYAKILTSGGYVTSETHSYHEAVAAINQSIRDKSPFALAIVDYVMPRIKGDRLARYIHKNHPEMAIIMFSAHPDERLFHEGFGIADRFIPKIQKYESLLPIVAEVLEEKDAENARLERHFVQKVLSPIPASSASGTESTRALPGKPTVGELCLDFANQRFTFSTVPLDLSPPEIAVLAHLAARAPRPVARARLEEVVQDDRQKETSASRLNRIIHSLRTKLRSANAAANLTEIPPREKRRKQAHEGELLKTLRGVGYYLDNASGE